MQRFESRRPNQPVRLKRVKYEGRSKQAFVPLAGDGATLATMRGHTAGRGIYMDAFASRPVRVRGAKKVRFPLRVIVAAEAALRNQIC